MYVCIIHTYIRMYVICMYVYTYVCMHVYTYICACVCVCVWVGVCIMARLPWGHTQREMSSSRDT